MRKFLVALLATIAIVIGAAAPSGAIGYIWGGNGSTIGTNIAGGSYDQSDNPLNNGRPKYQAYAVTAFQDALYRQGWLSYYDWVAENGVYGPKTEIAVHFFQQVFLDNHTDAQTPDGLANNGRIGPNTSKALFQPYVLYNEGGYGIPGHKLHGILMVESQYDPGAYNTGNDRGILEYNRDAHPDITDAEAVAGAIDAINDAGATVRGMYVQISNRDYGGGRTGADLIGSGLRWNMAAGGWNTPVGALGWADCYAFTGDAFNDCYDGTGTNWVGKARYYSGVVGQKGADFPN